MIGNDIIDINYTRRTTDWQRRGFLQKVFTTSERHNIARSEDPFTAIWRLWSMKEATYKAYVQQGGSPFNAPSRISVNMETTDRGIARIGYFSVELYTEREEGYLLSDAHSDLYLAQSRQVFQLPHTEPGSQSRETKQRLLKQIANRYALNESELSIQKTSANVPQVFFQTRKLPVDVAMSHHGHYGLFSIAEY